MLATVRAILILVFGLLAGPLLISTGIKEERQARYTQAKGKNDVIGDGAGISWGPVFCGCVLLLGTAGYMAYVWYSLPSAKDQAIGPERQALTPTLSKLGSSPMMQE
jgi:hypothetical protein